MIVRKGKLLRSDDTTFGLTFERAEMQVITENKLKNHERTVLSALVIFFILYTQKYTQKNVTKYHFYPKLTVKSLILRRHMWG